MASFIFYQLKCCGCRFRQTRYHWGLGSLWYNFLGVSEKSKLYVIINNKNHQQKQKKKAYLLCGFPGTHT